MREKAAVSRKRKGRRQRLVRSGFAAALVDVVLHQGDDLLQLVVQLGATRRGVGLQSAHHLKRKSHKDKTKENFFLTFRELVPSPAEVGHLPGRREFWSWRGEDNSSFSSSGPLTRAPLHATKALFAYLQKKKTHICSVIHAQ